MSSRSFPCLHFHIPGETVDDLGLVEQSAIQSRTGVWRLPETGCAQEPHTPKLGPIQTKELWPKSSSGDNLPKCWMHNQRRRRCIRCQLEDISVILCVNERKTKNLERVTPCHQLRNQKMCLDAVIEFPHVPEKMDHALTLYVGQLEGHRPCNMCSERCVTFKRRIPLTCKLDIPSTVVC